MMKSLSTQFIKIENYSGDEFIKILTLNRPEVKNAFHPEMISEITHFFQNENFLNKTKLIILKGEGSSFCAGADLNWMKDMAQFSYEENIEDSTKLWNMFESIQSCQIPVICIAQGAVFGGGLGLLACSDYVFVDEKTQYCFSEVKLGLAPAIISGFISQKISDAFVRPLMISGEVFNSQVAIKIGLAQQTFAEPIDLSVVVKKFSGNGIEAMKETKKLLNLIFNKTNKDELKKNCTKVISERRVSAEGQSRIKAYLNK